MRRLCSACALHAHCRYARGRRTPALINFALHAYLAIATCMLLPPPVGMPALNSSGSEQAEMRPSQQAQLELQPARAGLQQLQHLAHLEQPVAAAAALVEQDLGPAAASNSSAADGEVEVAEASLART